MYTHRKLIYRIQVIDLRFQVVQINAEKTSTFGGLQR